MYKIIRYIKKLIRKTNFELCDKLFSNMDINAWYGAPGDTVSYFDISIGVSIMDITLKHNDIKIYVSNLKKEFWKNIGYFDMNKNERIYFYSKIEEHLIKRKTAENKVIKEDLLYRLGLTEHQLEFLVENYKIIE